MNKFIKKNWDYVLLGVFIVLGFYLRVGGVIANSFAFTYDVGRDLLAVQKIVNSFDIPLIGQTTGLGGLYYGPWWYYILTPPFLISGGNPQCIAFFMVLVGLSTIIAGYVFGKIISGKLLGVIIALFLSFSTVMIGFSNQIWNPNIAPFLLLLLFISMFKRTKNIKMTVLRNIFIGFLLGLLLDSEIVFGVLLIGGVVFSYFAYEKIRFFSIEKIYMLFGFLITLLPRILFEFRHEFIMTKSLFLEKNQEQQIFDYANFFSVLPDRLSVFISQIGDTFGLPYIYSVLFCIAIAIILFLNRKMLKKEEKRMVGVVLIILFTFLVGSSFFARAIWGHYIVGLPVLYILLASVSILVLIRKWKIFGLFVVVILGIISMRPDGVIASIRNPYWEGNAAVYRNQISVIDYIYQNAKGRQFNVTVYTPAVHDYPYQYLFSWYGKNAYGYVPEKKTKNLLYIVIEPDPGFEGRVKDWLKIREGDGTVISEKEVKGGIVVQTRIR